MNAASADEGLPEARPSGPAHRGGLLSKGRRARLAWIISSLTVGAISAGPAARLLRFLGAVALAFPSMSPDGQAAAATLLGALATLGLVIAIAAHRLLWRRWFPDLYREDEFGNRSYFGRVYRVVLRGGAARLWVRRFRAGWPPWMLETLDAPQSPRRAGRLSPTLSIRAVGFRREGRNAWRAVLHDDEPSLRVRIDRARLRRWEEDDLDRKVLLAKVGAHGNLAVQRDRVRRSAAHETILSLDAAGRSAEAARRDPHRGAASEEGMTLDPADNDPGAESAMGADDVVPDEVADLTRRDRGSSRDDADDADTWGHGR
ncbi:MAG: hypothetical protein ACYDDF_12540 [Thermoplasmatota archaeon]